MKKLMTLCMIGSCLAVNADAINKEKEKDNGKANTIAIAQAAPLIAQGVFYPQDIYKNASITLSHFEKHGTNIVLDSKGKKHDIVKLLDLRKKAQDIRYNLANNLYADHEIKTAKSNLKDLRVQIEKQIRAPHIQKSLEEFAEETLGRSGAVAKGQYARAYHKLLPLTLLSTAHGASKLIYGSMNDMSENPYFPMASDLIKKVAGDDQSSFNDTDESIEIDGDEVKDLRGEVIDELLSSAHNPCDLYIDEKVYGIKFMTKWKTCTDKLLINKLVAEKNSCKILNAIEEGTQVKEETERMTAALKKKIKEGLAEKEFFNYIRSLSAVDAIDGTLLLQYTPVYEYGAKVAAVETGTSYIPIIKDGMVVDVEIEETKRSDLTEYTTFYKENSCELKLAFEELEKRAEQKLSGNMDALEIVITTNRNAEQVAGDPVDTDVEDLTGILQ